MRYDGEAHAVWDNGLAFAARRGGQFMSLRSCVSVAALAACVLASGVSPGSAQAMQDHHYFQGIDAHPAPAARHQPSGRGHLGHPSLNGGHSHPDVARAPAAGPPPGAYGGGFIELLATGRVPSRHAAIMNAPPPVSHSGPSMHVRERAPDYIQIEPAHAPVVNRLSAIAPDTSIAGSVDPRYERQEVVYSGPHRPGTIVVDTPNRYLFLVMPNRRALRYGIGVGRPGFEWAGVKRITRKAEWPAWRPPSEMLKRRPDLPQFMEGGPQNPLGARALYLGSSLYRIHGTNEPWTIGQNVSSGCIRMMNNDVIDLYQRVRVGAKVVVI